MKQWRRGFAVTPPELTKEDERYPGHDPRYASLTEQELPLTESLALTIDRVIPYWDEEIPATHQERRARDRCGARQLAARAGEIPG